MSEVPPYGGLTLSPTPCTGLGLGTNAMAGLVTRGCLEMQALAKAIGAP